MRFNKTILTIFALFAVILSAAAVSAIDDAGDGNVPDEYADSTDGEDPIDVSDSVNLFNSLDISDEDLDTGDDTYSNSEKTPDEEPSAPTAAGEDGNSKVSAGSTAAGNPLTALLTAIAITGTGFIRSRK